MLVISIFFYLLLSYTITLRINRIVYISEWAIKFFLTSISLNILIVEILHFFKSLNNQSLFLIIQGILISALVIFIIDPWCLVFNEKLSHVNIRLQKWGIPEIILHIIIFSIFIFVLYVGYQSPINNSDSLHTHLVRIFYWLQHNSLENWNAIGNFEISYPINIPIQGLWVFLLTGSEMSFFLIPWLALVIAIILIYKISIILGANPLGALISCLISLSFPVVLLQTYSYQGDVFIATLGLCSIYYLLLYIKKNSQISLYISILIISISIGAKQTIYLFLPIFGLVIFVLILKRRITPRLLLNIIGFFLVSFMLFSSFKFIQNSGKTLLGSPNYYNNLVSMGKKPMQGYLVNSLRYLYQAISLDGITGQIKFDLRAAKNDMFLKFSNYSSIDLESIEFLSEVDAPFSYTKELAVNEETVWFGILSIPVIFAATWVTLFSRDKLRIYYLVFSLFLLALFVFGQVVLKADGWGPYRGRYLVIPVLSIMPLVSFNIPKKSFIGGVIAVIIAIISVYLSASILIFNDSRPLLRQYELINFKETYVNNIYVTNIFNSLYRKGLYEISDDLIKTTSDRTTMYQSNYYEKLFFQNSARIEDMDFINRYIDEKQPLFIGIKYSVLEYALFGRNKIRDLYPVKNLADVERNSYVLVSKGLFQNFENFNIIAENANYVILFRQ